MVNFTNVTSFNNNADLGAVFRTNQVVVNRRNHHQGWNRRHIGVRVTVRKHDELDALSNCFIYFFTELRQSLFHGARTLVDFVESLELDSFTSTALATNVENLCQLIVIDHREIKYYLFGVLGTGSKQVSLGPQTQLQAGHYFFTNGVQWRVCYLSKLLNKVIEKQTWA